MNPSEQEPQANEETQPPPNEDHETSWEQDSASSLSDVDPLALGVDFLHLFEQSEDLVYLQHAIAILEGFLENTASTDPQYPEAAINLSVGLSYRFDQLGKLSDLEDAISREREAADLISASHHKAALLNNLGNSLLARFKHLAEYCDLEEAIKMPQDAVDLTPHDCPDKAWRLNNLGNSFAIHFQHLHEISDLENATSKQHDAVRLALDDHPKKPALLNNLGNSLVMRFEVRRDISDLREAISLQQRAVSLTHGCSDKPMYLNNLGKSLLTAFEKLGDMNDLENAISKQRDAVELIPEDHPLRPVYLNDLGNTIFTRFKYLGLISDMEVNTRQQDVVGHTPDDCLDKPRRLSSLGITFFTRFEHLGDLGDLENAISCQRDAVCLTLPDSHPEKPGYLNNLGNSLLTRFKHLAETRDLEEAISRLQDAFRLSPDQHPDRTTYLNNLAVCFLTRFRHMGEISDIEETIWTQEKALRLIPLADGHPNKPTLLNNFGNSFLTRFEHVGEISDLEKAISWIQEAVRLTTGGHLVTKARYLNNLGRSLLTRFKHLGNLNDLEKAISILRDSVRLLPDNHPERSQHLNNFGDCFFSRFERLGERNDLGEAILRYSEASCAPVGSIAIRFRASRKWISCALLLDHHSLLHAYSTAIHLLPQLAWNGLSFAHRYHELVPTADLVREAAAAALDSGLPETAVEWLEQGRCIVWGEMFRLRSPFDELSAVHPDHAHRLRALSVALEQSSAALETLSTSLPEDATDGARRDESVEQDSTGRRKVAIERDKLLQDIRSLPGFERFLLQADFSRLRTSAHAGPVVILNAAKARCDALVVLADVDHVIHVPLPYFTLARCKEIEGSLNQLVGHLHGTPREDRVGCPISETKNSEWIHVLSPLWKCIVKPVLDALAISIPGELSRIFWCPTGPFTFLPIHAAGLYDRHSLQPGHKAHDFVVSSYTPTLGVLAPLSQRGLSSNSGIRLLAVPQPTTDGLRKLPGVITELEHIRTIIDAAPAHVTLKAPSVGTVEEVLALMKETEWVHFACHGTQDWGRPTESGLCLAGGRRLRVSDMIALARPRGGLAFLSACQTAKGDEGLSDEAIHIAAGMLFAGYDGVVGTLWSISDRVAPGLAKDVYTQLFQRGSAAPGHREAACALHDAVGRLRDGNVSSFQDWLPFIHVGL